MKTRKVIAATVIAGATFTGLSSTALAEGSSASVISQSFEEYKVTYTEYDSAYDDGDRLDEIKATDDNVARMHVELTNVMVTSYQISGSGE